MGLFSKPEVVILKDSCDSKEYLSKLQELRKTVPDDSEAAEKIDKEIVIVNAGIKGEANVLYELENSDMDLVILRDLYIETNDGRSAQIDYFVISKHAAVIIECKNLFGNIEINNKGDFIRSFDYKGRKYKEGIYSPITQNERHLAVYKECWKECTSKIAQLFVGKSFDNFYRTVIVLANEKTVVNDRWAKKEVKEKVIRCDQLINYLRNLTGTLSYSKKEMVQLGESILTLNVEQRTDYLKKYEDLVEATKTQKPTTSEEQKTQTEQKLICPKCGGELVLRTAKKGDNAGNQFYGCSNFPKCRFIMNIQ
ncbi:NERD domain-containing protein [Pseudobutyrivibrio xylanivorans]|uniref:Topoisomerase DNA binding C4 zinc finger n=1 Tax=Pseudobutyrivibrio xylanivorans TaxID=185007 RepID=A0A1G5RUA2_PSEXY|nr:NERD domain-containing protein [Pseudobutyrivibrio xylanivorans]SCZ77507.1 Topoisomerase DNA binding C4 zinc finger [Pseudobutyrivibrio xylanivorans]